MNKLAESVPTVTVTNPADLMTQVRRFTESVGLVAIEHPDQLTLKFDMTTVAGGTRLSWPALSSLCQSLCPGLWTTISSLAGRRSDDEPETQSAAEVFNAVVAARFGRLRGQFMAVDPVANVVNRVSGGKMIKYGSVSPDEVQEILDLADKNRLRLDRAFVGPSRADMVFCQNDLGGTLHGTGVAPVLMLNPKAYRRRTVVRRIGLMVDGGLLVKGKLSVQAGREKTNDQKYSLETAITTAGEDLEEVFRTASGVMSRLIEFRIPASSPDEMRAYGYPMLRSHGVIHRLVTQVVSRLTYGRFGRTSSRLEADEIRLGGAVSRTGLDLVRSIAAEVERNPVIAYVAGLTTLSRVGFAVATGEVPLPTAAPKH